MTIDTAVIPVAGAGARMFPGTTAVEKCMMPVYANGRCLPLVEFMVADCAAAGIRRIIFVTSERGHVQLNDYFGPRLKSNLEQLLRTVGKTDVIKAELERRRSYDIEFEYIIQPPDIYGTTVPPYLAKDLLRGHKAFAVMGGDDFVYHQDGTSELAVAIAAWQNGKSDHVVTGAPIERAEAGKYGILQTKDDGMLLMIDERPPVERWPDKPIANITRYIFSDCIWPFFDAEMQVDRGTGEHLITTPVSQAAAAGQTFLVHTISGIYLDGGSPQGILAASNYITSHPYETI